MKIKGPIFIKGLSFYGPSSVIEVEIPTADLIAELEKRRPCDRCKAGDCNGCLWQSYSAQEFKKDNFKEAVK